MPNTHRELLELLTQILASMQAQFCEGISEYELISRLKERPYRIFNADALSDPLLLFQTHFILFHALYILRNKWRQQNIGELEIGATEIKLQPPMRHKPNIQVADPLADYYLDWKNLTQTDQADVEGMLSNFWLKMAGYDAHFSLSEEELCNAKACLELPENEDVSLAKLKQQYRKLQHKYHPDKGGSLEKSQSILQAYTTLQKFLLNTL